MSTKYVRPGQDLGTADSQLPRAISSRTRGGVPTEQAGALVRVDVPLMCAMQRAIDQFHQSLREYLRLFEDVVKVGDSAIAALGALLGAPSTPEEIRSKSAGPIP